MKKIMYKLILASSSPRRRELLRELGYNFEINISEIDESRYLNENVITYVSRLALMKARASYDDYILELSHKNKFEKSLKILVLGADTVVSYQNIILGKPKNYHDFEVTMRLLNNRAHMVYTSFALFSKDFTFVKTIKSEVYFKSLSLKQIKEYWDTGEPLDKAGGYGIQGLGRNLVRKIKGSYTNIVGLPLEALGQTLKNIEISTYD